VSNMSFNTSNDTFRRLMGGGLSYQIPPFQRDYAWTDEQWDDLWQDILGLFNNEDDAEDTHYMGYLVLQTSDHKQFDVIDGQQRITTITLIILAVLKVLQDLVDASVHSEENKKRLSALRESYVGDLDPVTLTTRSKLTLNRHNDTYYQNYIVDQLDTSSRRGFKSSAHQLRKAFAWFYEKIRDYLKDNTDQGAALAKFVDQFVDKLFFTVIIVQDELNAFKVFETLNARGVQLSSTDLLKNYLFSVVSKGNTDTHDLENLEKRWGDIVDALGSQNFPDFLRVYWNSRNKLVRKNGLFKEIRKNITQKQQAFDLLRNLDRDARIYASLTDPSDNIWNEREREAFENLRRFNVKQHLSLLLACYNSFFESDRNHFTRVVQAVAVLSFRYNVICGFPANEQERTYNAIAQTVSINGTDVIPRLLTLYPDDDTFKGAFAKKDLKTTNSRNRKIVKDILLNLEYKLTNASFDAADDSITIEHIMPENPDANWDEIEETIQDRMVYRLGNMTLLNAQDNKNLGNSGYDAKKNIYANSAYGVTRAIAENYHTWDEDKVNSRQEYMAKQAVSLWRIPS